MFGHDWQRITSFSAPVKQHSKVHFLVHLFLTGAATEDFLPSVFASLSVSVSPVVYQTQAISLTKAHWISVSAYQKREIYMFSLSNRTPSLATVLCLSFSRFLPLPPHTDIFK